MELNFNSVETIANLNASAAFQVDSGKVFKDDVDICSVIIDKTPGREVKIYHTGDNGGFQAYAAKYERSRVNVIMLENQSTVDRWTLQLEIERILR